MLDKVVAVKGKVGLFRVLVTKKKYRYDRKSC